jgi:hypothetical protein
MRYTWIYKLLQYCGLEQRFKKENMHNVRKKEEWDLKQPSGFRILLPEIPKYVVTH